MTRWVSIRIESLQLTYFKIRPVIYTWFYIWGLGWGRVGLGVWLNTGAKCRIYLTAFTFLTEQGSVNRSQWCSSFQNVPCAGSGVCREYTARGRALSRCWPEKHGLPRLTSHHLCCSTRYNPEGVLSFLRVFVLLTWIALCCQSPIHLLLLP